MSEDYLQDYNPQNGYQKQLDAIRKQQQAEERRLRDQSANLIRQFEAQKPVLKQQFTNNAQDAYVQKMNTLKEMPQVLAAQGYNGGLSESSNIKVDNQYGNAYNGHQRDYNSGLREVDNQIANTNASLNDMLAQNSTHYGGLIANAESGYNQMLMQAQKERKAYELQEKVRQQEFAYKQEQDKLANEFKQQQFAYSKQQAAKTGGGKDTEYKPRLSFSNVKGLIDSGDTSPEVMSIYNWYLDKGNAPQGGGYTPQNGNIADGNVPLSNVPNAPPSKMAQNWYNYLKQFAKGNLDMVDNSINALVNEGRINQATALEILGMF